ncbi:MAG: hypothetical protein A3C90_02480 [Candidatus Magasanikbacteria bacterium RIFCSPHIGHO2_02_FULL_51_14]|uniref:Uncharacterized protein n=1 Tax=Candidatus Magasanikbacteria bacterium RIFCSPHIGHO2_02_FULL_51_14 TaxID=1798683 RepID=A0A1F6MDL9_9BACT|nr:MAG: hypothetical protein A3C90_02480 [Candidatus Magasanikbacteria bacterium RIFCSPHIGHO2_02_FULL_51_14]
MTGGAKFNLLLASLAVTLTMFGGARLFDGIAGRTYDDLHNGFIAAGIIAWGLVAWKLVWRLLYGRLTKGFTD